MPTVISHRICLFPLFKINKIKLFFLSIFCILSIVFAAGGNCAQVTLAWDRNTEPDLAGYKIYYGTGSHVYNWFIDVGNVTTHTVTGLADGSTYFFAATAYDTSSVESTYSTEITYNSCTFSISPISASFGQQGGTGSVQVSTQAGCRWTANSGASWLTINAGSQGTGNGTVSYSVSSNSSTSTRTVASTIAGKVFTVTQTGSTSTNYTITASAGSNGSISPTGAVSVTSGASRTFTITPNSGYRVSSVLVDGASVGAVTSYTFSNITANHTIAATFTANDITSTVKYKLKTTKTKKNSGDGVITSSDSNINCGDICSNTYAKDTLVTLSASPNFGSTFTGWVSSSANCTGTGSCTVKIDKAKTIKAIFVGDYQLKIVNISKHGGSGRVRSSPSGIRCVTNSTTSCEASYSHGDQVTLSARPDSGSTFLGWQPASKCPGTGSCDVHVDKNYTVKAIFSGPE